MTLMSAWQRRLRDAWNASGIQQKDLAFRAGKPASSISRLMSEEEDADPQLSTLLPVVEALGLTMSDLFASDDRPLQSKLTPYDTNPRYRDVVNALESMPKSDRERAIQFTLWIAARIVTSAQPPQVPVPPLAPPFVDVPYTDTPRVRSSAKVEPKRETKVRRR